MTTYSAPPSSKILFHGPSFAIGIVIASVFGFSFKAVEQHSNSIEQKFAEFNACMQPAMPQGMQLDGPTLAQILGKDEKPTTELMVDVVGNDIWKPKASLRISAERSAVIDPVSAPPGLTGPQKNILQVRGKKCGAEAFGF